MIRKQLFSTLLLAATCFIAKGQAIHGNAGVESSQMPNTSKGDVGTGIVSVDPYTGTGGANVPIHSFSIDGLSLGVSLTYNARGIKVDEMASSIGLGWNLNAGGSISRTVYGIEDEVTLPSWHVPGSGGNPNFPQQDSVEGYLASHTSSFSSTQYLPSYSIDDKEYDVFHFNAGGRSFDFALKYDTSGNIIYQTYPKSEVQIEIVTKDCDLLDLDGNCISYINYRNGIQAKTGIDKDIDIMVFVITDEAGNKLYFEQGDVEVKPFHLGPDYSSDSGHYYPTVSWNLSKIITYTGMEVKYEYRRKYVEILANVTETLYPKMEVFDFNNNTVTYDPLEIKEQFWKGYKTHLAKIAYPNSTSIYFDTYEPTGSGEFARCDCKGDYILKRIRVENYFDDNTKNAITYRLNQAFFNTPAYGSTSKEYTLNHYCAVLLNPLTIPSNLDADSAKQKHLERGIRLKLKSIDRIAMDSTTTEQYYSFEYNSTALPYRFSSKKDFYGYFNGSSTQHPYIRTNFQSLLNSSSPTNDTLYLSIPYHADISYYDPLNGVQVYSSNWGAERTHNFDSMQAFVLNKVHNGTGGSVEIIYQDYLLSNPDSAYGYFPMLAIDQNNTPINCTIDSDLEGETVNDGLSVWKIISTNRYSAQHNVVKEYTYSDGERFNQGGYTWYPQQNKKILTNYFVSPMLYFNGSNHGFSDVIVTAKGLNNEQLSKTRYTFSNLIYYESGVKKSSMLKPTGYNWHNMPGILSQYRMGLLLKTENYDEHNYVTKVNESEFEYVSNWGLGFVNKRYFDGAFWDFTIIGHEILRVSSSTFTRYVRDSSLSTIYPFTINYEYGYDHYDNLNLTTWTDSKGDIYKKHKYYNYNFIGGSNPTVIEMSRRKMQHSVSSDTWKMTGSDSVLISYGMNAPLLEDSSDYLKFPASFTLNSAKPLTSSEVFFSSPLPIAFADALDYRNHTFYGTKFSKGNEHTRYDNKGNIIETRINNKDIYLSNIWDSKTMHRIAEVQNAKYEDIAFTSFEGDYEAIGVEDEDKGNLDFDKSAISTFTAAGLANAMTGKYVYDISSQQNYIVTKPLDDKKYIISFWFTGNSDPVLDIVDNSTVITSLNCELQNTVGIWKLYSATISIDSGRHLQIRPQTGGQSTYIDEIRLHPAQASMTTYTYKPLMGAGSINSSSNYIIYMEYDAWGRVVINRDMRGNIISKIEHAINSTSPSQYSQGGSSSSGGGSGG